MKSNKRIRQICMAAVALPVAVLLIIGSFVFITKHKVTGIDVSASPDGKYEVLFQSVGEPDWPFSDSHARLVLKHGGRTVSKLRLDVANDGKILCENNWIVHWEEDCASVTVSGEEQPDTVYTLFFDETV